ncbi:MAG: hypothetical protein ACK4FK_00740 [Ferrovibrio sp.]|uniref:hypothetical protein n=1 Tax=Ferrovibrio sp. TaxID=1917215 RepID=UPI00391A4630
MADALKEFYNAAVVAGIAQRVSAAHPAFPADHFRKHVMAVLPPLSLMQRARAIADALRQHLPQDYPAALEILLNSLAGDDHTGGIDGMGGFRHLPLLNFVGAYGLDHPGLSLNALREMTKHFSAEFDIRYFIERHYDLTMTTVRGWTDDPHWAVRRLCSEGLRPRLPWGLRLKRFIADPRPVLEVIESLRADAHDSVRRSVANNLNDIAKDNPDAVITTTRRWQAEDRDGTADAVRHGLRSLVKKGDRRALALLGFDHRAPVTALDFAIAKARYRVGDRLSFHIGLRHDGKKPAKLSVDYAIHWRNARGGLQAKVFKLAKPMLGPGETVTLEKTHSLKPITTRRYYAGEHKVEILVNGQSVAEGTFRLLL